MIVKTFERLERRYYISGVLRTESGLRIGGEKSTAVAETDLPVIRDGIERPYIPGSSLKGVLRSGLESILRGLAGESLWSCDLFNDPCSGHDRKDKTTNKTKEEQKKEVPLEKILEGMCTVCGLFGCQKFAGRLFFHDLPLSEKHAPPPMIRNGVGIDRDLETAAESVKYNFEVIPPGVGFDLEIILENPGDVQLALTLKMLELLNDGHVLLGGFTSRGLGKVRLEDIRIKWACAEILLGGKDLEDLDYTAESKRASQVLKSVIAGEEVGDA